MHGALNGVQIQPYVLYLVDVTWINQKGKPMKIAKLFHSFSDTELAEEWKSNEAAPDDISKIQELFRMAFSSSSDVYYSFCDNTLLEHDSYWHCNICGTCNKWRMWHCDKCNKCMWFCVGSTSLPNVFFLCSSIFFQALTVRACRVNDVENHLKMNLFQGSFRMMTRSITAHSAFYIFI